MARLHERLALAPLALTQSRWNDQKLCSLPRFVKKSTDRNHVDREASNYPGD
jgi:hypothetical protein